MRGTKRAALIHVRTERPSSPAYQRLADRLNDHAARILRAHGWQPALHAAGDASTAATLAAARNADLVIVMGGEDVHPEFYDGDVEYPRSGVHDRRADEAQIAVVHDAVRRGAPILGICRGHQVINVALGGGIVQHLPQDGTHRIDRPHGSKQHSFTPHAIHVTDDRWSHAIDLRTPVQSSHHQAAGRLGSGLTEIAVGHDGVTEAIAHDDAPILGVQWHPEHPAAPAVHLTGLVDGIADRRERNAHLNELRNPRVAA